MDTKQENPRSGGREWCDEVQTFDFGVQVKKLDDANDRERFVEVSEETVKNMAKKKNAARTNESTKSAVKILLDYCRNLKIVFPSATATAAELNFVLRKFYIAVRTKKGEVYKINSLKSIRFALQRYFLEKKTY